MRRTFMNSKTKLVLNRSDKFRITNPINYEPKPSISAQKIHFQKINQAIAMEEKEKAQYENKNDVQIRPRATTNPCQPLRSISASKLSQKRGSDVVFNTFPVQNRRTLENKIEQTELRKQITTQIDKLKKTKNFQPNRKQFLFTESQLQTILQSLLASKYNTSLNQHKKLTQKTSIDPYAQHDQIPERDLDFARLVVNEKITSKREKQLKHLFQNIDFFIKFQANKYQNQIFWSLCQKYEKKKHTQQDLDFLLQKISLTNLKIQEQQQVLRALQKKIYQINQQLSEKNLQMTNIQNQLQQKKKQIATFQEELQKINTYEITKQGTFLGIDVKEYKQIEQQMFNMGEMFRITTPTDMKSWIGKELISPKQGFDFQLAGFYNYVSTRDNEDPVDINQVKNFRNNLKKYYVDSVNKIYAKLEEKSDKMRVFIRLMSRLSQCTEGKRKYLTKINKEMAATQFKIDDVRMKLQPQIQQIIDRNNESRQVLLLFNKLLMLTEQSGFLYKQAKIFY